MDYSGALVLLLVSFASADPLYCPAGCSCQKLPFQEGVTVNCIGLDAIPRNLDPDTIYLDLSGNYIRTIPANCFDGLFKLAVVKLNDNVIEEIEPFAFAGLDSLQELNLRRNAIQIIRENAFAKLSGSPGMCGTGLRDGCRLDLRDNPIQDVESYAFAWMRYLDIHIGGHDYDMDQELSIRSYAFYGSGDFGRLEIGDVPRLKLYPRAFTNTERVGVVRIHDVLIPELHGYYFQGLTHVQRIVFENVEFHGVESSALSGVEYAIGKRREREDEDEDETDDDNRDHARDRTRDHHRDIESPFNLNKRLKESPADQNDITRFLHCGGEVSFVRCIIPFLPAHAFTDTNLAHVHIQGCDIATLEAHVFRGMSCLRTLLLRENRIDALRPKSLGQLSNVKEVILDRNTLEVIPRHCFQGSQVIGKLRITVPDDFNVLLETQSFSGLHGVTEMELKGGEGASLTLQPDSLAHLDNVDRLTITRFHIESLGERALHGLSKVRALSLRHCRVTYVDRRVFGARAATSGVGRTHLDAVECGRCETAATLRELASQLRDFHVVCSGGGEGGVGGGGRIGAKGAGAGAGGAGEGAEGGIGREGEEDNHLFPEAWYQQECLNTAPKLPHLSALSLILSSMLLRVLL